MVRPIRVAVLVSGSGTNLQAILDAVEAGTIDAKVVVVFSNKRGAHALARAAKHKVPCEVLEADSKDREAYDREAAALIAKYGPDLLVFAGYMRVVTKAFIERFPDRIINIHPALLPAFPGMHAQAQALEFGVKVTGCTTHFVRAEVDAGPIILQAGVPVEEGDTVEALTARILVEEHKILPRTIQLFAEGRLKVEGRKVMILHPESATHTGRPRQP
ncbi:MAG TPA: phosphoribosylglycinamide formyltransferase [Candidatus Thermoplasmatota archaeon]|nr:phosphoribosylglycinamide formyltransferase [Candidatus Thermoplasmatota archaeon]